MLLAPCSTRALGGTRPAERIWRTWVRRQRTQERARRVKWKATAAPRRSTARRFVSTAALCVHAGRLLPVEILRHAQKGSDFIEEELPTATTTATTIPTRTASMIIIPMGGRGLGTRWRRGRVDGGAAVTNRNSYTVLCTTLVLRTLYCVTYEAKKALCGQCPIVAPQS